MWFLPDIPWHSWQSILHQEVDEYDGFYKGKMEILGYSGLYIQRGGQKRDGCGIFYKQDR